MRTDALTYAQHHRAEALADLQELLRIPSISTLPESKVEVQRAAQWLADKLDEFGLQNIKIISTAGHPIIYADWLKAGPGAPTLLIYGHYDVQPVDPLDEWLTPPFEPTVKGDNMFGRGVTDDKGQLYVHVAAVEAYLKSTARLPLNIKFMLEGEEEKLVALTWVSLCGRTRICSRPMPRSSLIRTWPTLPLLSSLRVCAA
jgi:acetylornithine deacetylase/succinyl-diaminopimelate desuccinylase-like protein